MKCYKEALTLDPTEGAAKQRLETLTAAMEKQVGGGGRGRSVGKEERGGRYGLNCSLCLPYWDACPPQHWMVMGRWIQNLFNWIDHVHISLSMWLFWLSTSLDVVALGITHCILHDGGWCPSTCVCTCTCTCVFVCGTGGVDIPHDLHAYGACTCTLHTHGTHLWTIPFLPLSLHSNVCTVYIA